MSKVGFPDDVSVLLRDTEVGSIDYVLVLSQRGPGFILPVSKPHLPAGATWQCRGWCLSMHLDDLREAKVEHPSSLRADLSSFMYL